MIEDPEKFFIAYRSYRNKIIAQLELTYNSSANSIKRTIDSLHTCYFSREINSGILNYFTDEVLKNSDSSISDENIKKIIFSRSQIKNPSRTVGGSNQYLYEICKAFEFPEPKDEIFVTPKTIKNIINEFTHYKP